MNLNENPENNEKKVTENIEQKDIPIEAPETEVAPVTSSKMEAITIGQLEQPKGRKTSLIMFIFIVVFIAVVFFLPQIEDFIKKTIGQTDDTSSRKVVITPNNNNQEHPFNTNTKIFVDNHLFTGFLFDSKNNRVSFKITNKNIESSDINSKKLYIILYDDKRVPEVYHSIELRFKLVENKEHSYYFDITKEQAQKVKLVNITPITEDDYREVTLNKDENGEDYLLCTRESQELKYYFVNDKLVKINEIFSMKKVVEEESSDATAGYLLTSQIYYNKHRRLKSIDTINLNYDENNEGFSFEVILKINPEQDYTKYDTNYFSNETKPKVVNFRLESKGFNCQ